MQGPVFAVWPASGDVRSGVLFGNRRWDWPRDGWSAACADIGAVSALWTSGSPHTSNSGSRWVDNEPNYNIVLETAHQDSQTIVEITGPADEASGARECKIHGVHPDQLGDED